MKHLNFLAVGQVRILHRISHFKRDAGTVEKTVRDALQRRQQAHRVHAGAKVGHDLAQVVMHFSDRQLDIREIFQGTRIVVGQHGIVQQGQAHLDVGQCLGNGVVHLVDHFLALPHDCCAQALAFNPGIVQGHKERRPFHRVRT